MFSIQKQSFKLVNKNRILTSIPYNGKNKTEFHYIFFDDEDCRKFIGEYFQKK